MFLKSLQIQGFKSFPDKIKLDFKQGITCTVGPNGSGKSNVSDAVRWVFGEQAPSALRIKSMEDIVFNGTNTRKASGFAEVIITIDNTSRWLQYDSDEISVCRRFYRSGSSEYKINGKSVLLREVNELFMDTGIGRDGYSIIGQGKIADIVETKANDRRVIFEEAAGISKYRHRREETERNLHKAEDNLVHLQVVLSGLEERVGPLERESEKAKKWLELREEQKKAQVGLWLLTLDRSNEALRDQGYEITRLDNEYNSLSEGSEELDRQAEQLYLESSQLLAQKDEQVRAAAGMEENAARLEGEAAVTDAEILHGRQDIARIEGEIADSANNENQLNAEIEQKQRELVEKGAAIAAQQSKIDNTAARIEALRSGESGIGSELQELRGKQNSLTIEQSEHQLRAARAESQLAEIETRAANLEATLAERTARQSTLETDREETSQALQAAKEKISELSNAVSGYQLKLDRQTTAMDEAKRNADDLRIEAQDKARRAKIIEDLERSLEGYPQSVRRVMKHAESGGLRGVHGPVSRFINVSGKYSVAIETALGAAMQNIIVDDENAGKQAMEFLKKTNGGRATFLPITTIRPRNINENGLDDCAGFVNIAAELVECDGKYRDIVGNLLGNICVVEDLDSAISIARRFKNRFRIVTLDGQVINAGGSMTGGSHDRNSGLLSRKGELEKLRADAQRLEISMAQAKEEYDKAQARVTMLRRSLSEAQGELADVQSDSASFVTELRMLDEQITANFSEIESIKQERSGNTDRTAQLRAEKAEATHAAANCAEKLAELTAKIAESTGSIDKLSAQREALLNELNEAGMKRLSLIKESESIEAAIEQLRERIAQGSGRENMLRRQIAELTGRVAELESLAAQQRAEAAGLREDAAKMGDIAALELRRGEMEREIQEKRRESRELMERRGDIDRRRTRLEEQRQHKQQEYDSIIQQMMEEYNLTRREAAEQFDAAEDEREGKRQVSSLTSKIRALGDVHVGAIEEYKEVFEKYTTYKTQMDDVLKSKGELEKLIDELTETMKTMFTDAFDRINKNFSEIFPELFGGGSAKMTLVDPEDCLGCGIDIDVKPPGKEKQSITGMSGGEKSIIAVAIYFAIMRVRPSPFCFLDEIDHALDEHNVSNVANYIQRFTDNTQYVVITHRRGMMEAASMLYGVTKQDGVSKVISLDLDEVEEQLGKLD